MKKIIKIKAGDVAPSEAVFLFSNTEEDRSKIYRYESINKDDVLNYIPLVGSVFGTMKYGHRFGKSTYLYYEIKEAK